MNILIAYGTSEGQTRKIAEAVAARLNELCHQTRVVDTAQNDEIHVALYDRIIVAGSVHNQQHQETVEIFVMASLSELQKRPTLFLSVSLAAAFSEGIQEAQSYVETFLDRTRWTPTQHLLVAGALRYAEYDYFKAQIIEHVVVKNRSVAGTKGDYEFTDWESLLQAVATFVRA